MFSIVLASKILPWPVCHLVYLPSWWLGKKNNRIPDRSFYIRQYATVIALFSGFGINSFAELQSEKEELEKKYIHVLQILESEKTAKWQLLQQCEEQAELVSSLKTEVLYKHKFIIINWLMSIKIRWFKYSCILKDWCEPKKSTVIIKPHHQWRNL